MHPAAAKLVLHRFSTADLPIAQRHEAWRNRDWPSLAPGYWTIPLSRRDEPSRLKHPFKPAEPSFNVKIPRH